MPSYTVTAVGENVRDWNSTRDGAMKSYRVTLKNDRGAEMPNVEVSYKASDPKPQPGLVLNDVTVDTSGSYGPKVVFPRKFGGGGGGGFRGKTVEERRSIAMQASQKVAADIVTLALQYDKTPAELEKLVLSVADTLWRQVQNAETGK